LNIEHPCANCPRVNDSEQARIFGTRQSARARRKSLCFAHVLRVRVERNDPPVRPERLW
jgi:hypothetical protein